MEERITAPRRATAVRWVPCHVVNFSVCSSWRPMKTAPLSRFWGKRLRLVSTVILFIISQIPLNVKHQKHSDLTCSIQSHANPRMSQYQLSAVKILQELTGQLPLVPCSTLHLLKMQMEIRTCAVQWTQTA